MLNSALPEELLVSLRGVPRNIARLLLRVGAAMQTIDATPAVFNLDNDEWHEIASCIEKHGEWRGYLSATTHSLNPRTHKLVIAEFSVDRNVASVVGSPVIIPITYAPDLTVKQTILSVMNIVGGCHEQVAEVIRSQAIKAMHIA